MDYTHTITVNDAEARLEQNITIASSFNEGKSKKLEYNILTKLFYITTGNNQFRRAVRSTIEGAVEYYNKTLEG